MNYELLRVDHRCALVDDLLDNLRFSDLLEAQQMHPGQDLKVLMDTVLEESLWSLLVLTEGKPCLLFGLTPDGEGGGCPWLIATTQLETDGALRRALVRESPRWVARMHQHYGLLWNLVHVDNLISKRWLAALGFTIMPPHGAFQTFYKRES